MKRLIIAVASFALLAGVGTADAKKASHKKGYSGSQGRLIQRDVYQRAPYANPGYRYGPYPEYPQSPPGGAP